MENFVFGFRDGKNSDPGSGINIPDLQHWIETDCRERGDEGRGGGVSTS
jgi:hypothetical protein